MMPPPLDADTMLLDAAIFMLPRHAAVALILLLLCHASAMLFAGFRFRRLR